MGVISETNGNFCILSGLVQVIKNKVFIPKINSFNKRMKIKKNELLANKHIHEDEIFTLE